MESLEKPKGKGIPGRKKQAMDGKRPCLHKSFRPANGQERSLMAKKKEEPRTLVCPECGGEAIEDHINPGTFDCLKCEWQNTDPDLQGASTMKDRKMVIAEGGPADGCEMQVFLDVDSFRVSIDEGLAIYKQVQRRGNDGLVGEHWDFHELQRKEVLTFEQNLMLRMTDIENKQDEANHRLKEIYEGMMAFANVVGTLKQDVAALIKQIQGDEDGE